MMPMMPPNNVLASRFGMPAMQGFQARPVQAGPNPSFPLPMPQGAPQIPQMGARPQMGAPMAIPGVMAPGMMPRPGMPQAMPAAPMQNAMAARMGMSF